MISLDELRQSSEQILFSTEFFDFTFITHCPNSVLVKFLHSLKNTKTLLVSDYLQDHEHFEVPYQTSIYDKRFNVKGNCWIDYSLATYMVSHDPQILKNYDFVILDGVDDRTMNSDIFFALVLNLKLEGTFICNLKSDYKIETYIKFVESFNRKTNFIRLLDYPERNLYFIQAQPGADYLKEICRTIETIFLNEVSSKNYDILVFLPGDKVKGDLSFYLRNSTLSNYSISEFTAKEGNTRRVFLETNIDKIIRSPNNHVKYIIDSGLHEVTVFDHSGFNVRLRKFTTRNNIEQNLSVLRKPMSSYFCLVSEDLIKQTLFEYGVDGPSFMIHFLYILHQGFKINEFRFLRAPSEENIRATINFLLYLNLVEIREGDAELTGLGNDIMKFQFHFSVNYLYLFVALLNSSKLRCTKELLKITSILISISISDLSLLLKSEKIKKNVVADQSDFLSLINIFNDNIDNEAVVSKSGILNNRVNHILLETYKALRNTLNQPINFEKASEESIYKCLISGFQFQMVKTVSIEEHHDSKFQLVLEPILPLVINKHLKITMAIPKSLDKNVYDVSERFRVNDVMIFFKGSDTDGDDDNNNNNNNDSNNRYWLDIVSKIPYKALLQDLKMIRLE